MQAAKAYVRQDEHGVLRVGETRVMLDSVVAAFHLGHSVETIAQQYPALTLEEAYGAISILPRQPSRRRQVPSESGGGLEPMA